MKTERESIPDETPIDDVSGLLVEGIGTRRQLNQYSGPHCLDQKSAFLSYSQEAVLAPSPTRSGCVVRPRSPCPMRGAAGPNHTRYVTRPPPARYTMTGVR